MGAARDPSPPLSLSLLFLACSGGLSFRSTTVYSTLRDLSQPALFGQICMTAFFSVGRLPRHACSCTFDCPMIVGPICLSCLTYLVRPSLPHHHPLPLVQPAASAFLLTLEIGWVWRAWPPWKFDTSHIVTPCRDREQQPTATVPNDFLCERQPDRRPPPPLPTPSFRFAACARALRLRLRLRLRACARCVCACACVVRCACHTRSSHP